MKEITSAIIGISLVLTAVFIPMAFSTGAAGAIYRQFTISMAVSILFSAFLALTLTPALCATLLKPVHGHERKRGFFAWFDRKFDDLSRGYESWVTKLVKRTGRMMAAFAVVLVLLGVGFMNLGGWNCWMHNAATMPRASRCWICDARNFPAPPGSTAPLAAATSTKHSLLRAVPRFQV